MPLPRPILTIPYKNDTDERIPPFAVLQFMDDVESTDTYIAVKVIKPDGAGEHFALDNGKGAMESSDEKYCYGECIKAFNGPLWAHYTNADPPETAWETEVGPVEDEWFVDDTGTGFVYAGLHDPDNERILVMQLAVGGGSGAQGRLTSVLAPCDNSLTGATTFTFAKLVKDDSIDPQTDPVTMMEEVDADGESVMTTGVNRSPLEAAADGHVVCVKIKGEWVAVLAFDICPE